MSPEVSCLKKGRQANASGSQVRGAETMAATVFRGWPSTWDQDAYFTDEGP